jgi:predicted permease
MLLRLFSIIAPVFACAAFGYVWARTGRPFHTEFVTRLIMNVGAPCLIVASFSKADGIDAAALGTVGSAALLVVLTVATLSYAVLRITRLEVRTYFNSMVFQNSGNMGLPLCLFAFGREGLSLGIVVFLVVSTLHFTVGVGIMSGERHPGRILRLPLVWSSALAVALVVTGWSLPAWVVNTVDIMGGLAIPLMLLSLGVTLSTLRVETLGRSLVFALLRFGFGFGAGLLVAELVGLSGVARGVVVLQASMPSAVFNYLMAARYNRRPEQVAGIVVMTTLLSFGVLPAVLWVLLR